MDELELDERERIKLREENWDIIMMKQGEWKLKNYKYPKKIFNELRDISDYCEANNIELNFIIFPSHPAYFSLIDSFNLSEERKQFKLDISSLGNTYDYSFENSFTRDSLIYFDLYHAKQHVTDTITYDVFNFDDPALIYDKYSVDK